MKKKIKKILTTLALLWAKLIDSIFGINKPDDTGVTYTCTNNKEPKQNNNKKKNKIMLNRARRRFLASKIRKANHNERTFRNIKAHQLPHSVPSDDLLHICLIAGVEPEEVLKRGN